MIRVGVDVRLSYMPGVGRSIRCLLQGLSNPRSGGEPEEATHSAAMADTLRRVSPQWWSNGVSPRVFHVRRMSAAIIRPLSSTNASHACRREAFY